VGLVNNLTAGVSSHASEHVLADLGEAGAALEMMNHVLRHVATTIDGDPLDRDGRAHFLALVARQVVHDSAQTILARVASAGGARPLCLDPDQARRAADLYVYLAQHHGRADAAELGRMMTGEPS